MASAFADVAEGLFDATSLQDTLDRIVEFAVITIEACEFAGIFLIEGDVITTPASTAPIVNEIDELQHVSGEGPCLDAIAQGLTFYADELENDDRWPSFGPLAYERGMRSLLALPLTTHGTFGALNLYSSYPQAFGVVDRARGLLLASMAGYAFASARTRAEAVRHTENLEAALVTRELVGQAQGILIERERITPEQAFHILRQASQHLNLKLREVAKDLVDTGVRPETGSPDRPS
jgi:GAF domain-containing protein